MKVATSRTSRISVEAREGFENSLPGIPDSKWHEFLEKEDNDIFLLSLREEILQKTMEKIFQLYLEKQAVAFTVHCSYLAWVKVIDVCYMFKDPGDFEDPKVRESWEPDEEATPSPVDSWASECIKVKKPDELPKHKMKAKKSFSERSLPDSLTESLESVSFMADLFESAGEDRFPLTPDRISTSTRKESIFTKTLSMSRQFLPMVQPQKAFISCKECHVPIVRDYF